MLLEVVVLMVVVLLLRRMTSLIPFAFSWLVRESLKTSPDSLSLSELEERRSDENFGSSVENLEKAQTITRGLDFEVDAARELDATSLISGVGKGRLAMLSDTGRGGGR
jgi:hypothetical protein